MRIETDLKLDFSDVLIVPKRSTLKSRKDVELKRKHIFKHSGQTWEGIPLIASNMDTVGTFQMYDALVKQNLLTTIHKHYKIEEWWRDFVDYHFLIPSIGTAPEDLDKFTKIFSIHKAIEFVCIDVANGYGEYFPAFISLVRGRFPETTIIAGNVVTAEMTEQLILSGADVVKVGLGSGSACTTRIQTGVGYPQLSAVIECADAAHGLGGHIISDGGCTCPGDVAKAFGAGADFVMLGGMLAGHDESGGELITERHRTDLIDTDMEGNNLKHIDVDRSYKIFYGMSSDTAMEKHNGGVADYRSSEGRTVKVEYKGPVEKTIQNILGGLRSTCTYIGAPSLKQLSKCTTFIRVTKQFNDIYT